MSGLLLEDRLFVAEAAIRLLTAERAGLHRQTPETLDHSLSQVMRAPVGDASGAPLRDHLRWLLHAD